MSAPATLPSLLASKLSHFRRRVWIVKLAEGILASVVGLTLSYLLVLGLDRIMETPTWVRTTLLILGAAVPGLGLPLKWHRWVWRQRRLEDAAKLLRWKFPRLGDQLLGIVELAKDDGSKTGRSTRLVEAAMAQADDAVRDQDLTHAVPHAKHWQWGFAAVFFVVLTATGFALINDAARNALVRWAMPWKDTERYTFARIDALPNPLIVPTAEPFELPVSLQPEGRWQPGSAQGRIHGQAHVHASQSEGQFTLAFPPQQHDTDLRVRVGDVRETIALQPRTRPELQALHAHLTLPDYLQYETKPILDVRGGTVSILAGSEAQFEAVTSRDLAEAAIDGTAIQPEANRLKSDPVIIEGEVESTFTWTDIYGLQASEPLTLKVLPLEDEAPTLLAQRDSNEQVVLETEVVPFDLTASDDFGIKQVGLRWQSFEEREEIPNAQGRKIAAVGGPEEREISARATFCAAREGIAPQSLEIQAWAEDYLSGREPSTSTTFVLHVLSATDHALWVTTQMNQWLASARETYEREQQLHQTNKQLRALSAAELDQPENRRRVSDQSRAELANANRLNALNQSGRKLIEQATKNEEFDAERLESWATLLQSLQDIAANRMPNVADLLKESSNAEASGTPSADPSDPNTKPNPGQTPPTSSQESGPKLAQGEKPDSASGQPQAPAEEGEEHPPAPTLEISDSGMPLGGEEESTTPGDEGEPKKPSGSALGLPSNTLAAAPGQESPPPGPRSPAQQPLDAGVEEQANLLEEFAKVSDELAEILASLEASTFVKRLKAASQAQQKLATNMRAKSLAAFGVADEPTDFADTAEAVASAESDLVKVIQSDMAAYVQRRPDQHFRQVLGEMRETRVVSALAELGERATENLSGNTIHGAELWADTLDRWAEEMVKAGSCSNCSAGSSDSLPPEVVLKVMQALRDEMALRDETRELENAKEGLKPEEHQAGAIKLSAEQARIAEHTLSAIEDIVALENGAQRFGKALQLLGAVTQVMNEATSILAHHETGAPAIGAETEAIELLLQTKRQGKGGGGGGGNNPGGGGGAESASLAALSELGPGGDPNSVVQARRVGQATGRAGREFPEEFKAGLDAYFANLEGNAKP